MVVGNIECFSTVKYTYTFSKTAPLSRKSRGFGVKGYEFLNLSSPSFHHLIKKKRGGISTPHSFPQG